MLHKAEALGEAQMEMAWGHSRTQPQKALPPDSCQLARERPVSLLNSRTEAPSKGKEFCKFHIQAKGILG